MKTQDRVTLAWVTVIVLMVVGVFGAVRSEHRPAVHDFDFDAAVRGGTEYWQERGRYVPPLEYVQRTADTCPDGASDKGCADIGPAHVCRVYLAARLHGAELAWVAAHEVGHCIGFFHDRRTGYNGVMRTPINLQTVDYRDDNVKGDE